MKLTLTRLSIAMALLSISGASLAVVGAQVVGHSSSTQPIATTTHLSSVHSALTTTINDAGTKISTAIETQGKGDANNAVQSSQANEEALKGQSQGDAAARVAETYSPNSMGYDVCTRISNTSVRRTTQSIVRKTSKTIQDRINNYSLKGEKSIVAQNAFGDRLSETEKGVELIYSNDKALSREDWEKGQEYIKNVINPIPDAALPKEVLSTVDSKAAKRYNELVNYKVQALSLPLRVMSDIAADDEPLSLQGNNNPMDNIRVSAIGYIDGENPYVNEQGEMPKRLARRLEIESRTLNKDWVQGLLKSSNKGVLVEMAQMQAIQLDQMSELLDLTRKIALMDATKLAQDTHKSLNGSITKLHDSLLSTGTSDAANIK